MTIDRKKLLEAREAFIALKGISSEQHTLICDVLSAYAATLPRELEVEQWAIVSGAGLIVELDFVSELAAARRLESEYPLDHQVVRLSGLVTLPPGGKD